jgi:predicted transcriptional regulator
MLKGLRLTGWLRGSRDPLHAALGHLEREVMEVVWTGREQAVRDVQVQLPRTVAYTTVMTTLDRLYKKGLVIRRREGRAFVYTAVYSQDEMAASLTSNLLEGVLANGSAAARPFLSNLVDAVSAEDHELLDELERLVRDKRQQMRNAQR